MNGSILLTERNVEQYLYGKISFNATHNKISAFSMLRFQIHPDKVFIEILKDALQLMSDQILDGISCSTTDTETREQLDFVLPNAGRVFNFRTALDTVKDMDACLRKPELYQLNDYHYLLLYDALSNLCDLHNDAIKACKTEEDRIQLSQIGDYYIEELLFIEMVDIYFYDIDFLLAPEDAFHMGMEGRKSMDVSDQTFAITQGLAPHPEELELKVCEGDKPIEMDSSPYFGGNSKVYPDLDYKMGA